MNLIEAIKHKDIPMAIELINAGYRFTFRYCMTSKSFFFIKIDPYYPTGALWENWELLDISCINLYNFLIRIFK